MSNSTNPDDVQDLMDKIADSQADISLVADVLATDSIPADICDENGNLRNRGMLTEKIVLELEAELEALLVEEEKEDISALLNACTVNDPKDPGNSANQNCPTDLLT